MNSFKEDYADVSSNISQIVISETSAQAINICPIDKGVHVSGLFSAQLNCGAILNSKDDGVGYYYPDAQGNDRHLWFYHGGDTAEIGVYNEGEQLLWMSTPWNICK